MSELKPCPQEAEALDIIESMLDVADMKCTGPLYADDPPRNGLCRIPEEDAAILRQYVADRRAQPTNEPLTRKHLRSMNDQRVWVQCPGISMAALVAYHSDDGDGDDVYLTNNLGGRSTFEEVLEQGGVVYRRQPERSENE